MNTEKLASDANALGVLFGSKLIRAQQLCEAGTDGSIKELSQLAGEINAINGTLNGLYYTAKQLLSEDDFSQFVYRSGISADLVQEGIDRAESTITSLPLS